MSKQSKTPRFSEAVSAFCAMVENTLRDYRWNYEEVNRLEKLTQDYLHALELSGAAYKERAKIATKLAEARKMRRASKDTVAILTPLVEFLDTDRGKDMMNMMREVLGKTRKVEEQLSRRTYRNRVLEEENE